MDAEDGHNFKVIIVGDAGCGKTSLIKKYVHDYYSSNYKATIGIDFALKTIEWENGEIIQLQLWDIAGQERHVGHLTRVYYQNAVAALVVYDITKKSTFDNVEFWKKDIDGKVFLPNSSTPIPCLLIGNKCDLTSKTSKSKEEMDTYLKEKGFINFYETSAKNGTNIGEAMNFLVKKVMDLLGETEKMEKKAAEIEKKKKEQTAKVKIDQKNEGGGGASHSCC